MFHCSIQPSIWKTAAGRVLEKAQAAVWQPALWRFRPKNTIVIVNSRFIAISLPFDWFAYTVYVVYTVIIQDVDSCRLLSFYPGPKDFHFHLEFKHWRNSMKFLPPNHALELAQAEALKSCCYHNVMIELHHELCIDHASVIIGVLPGFKVAAPGQMQDIIQDHTRTYHDI